MVLSSIALIGAGIVGMGVEGVLGGVENDSKSKKTFGELVVGVVRDAIYDMHDEIVKRETKHKSTTTTNSVHNEQEETAEHTSDLKDAGSDGVTSSKGPSKEDPKETIPEQEIETTIVRK